MRINLRQRSIIDFNMKLKKGSKKEQEVLGGKFDNIIILKNVFGLLQKMAL
jgi:hypothetical protein